MEVVVEDRQLSLAIGKKGQNVRLAAKLSGWKIDIKSEEEKRHEVEEQFGDARPADALAETEGAQAADGGRGRGATGRDRRRRCSTRPTARRSPRSRAEGDDRRRGEPLETAAADGGEAAAAASETADAVTRATRRRPIGTSQQ